MQATSLSADIISTVTFALQEDLNHQEDITAELIPADNQAVANVISRDECIVCGVDWVNEVFKQLDNTYGFKGELATKITWFVNDGEHVAPNTTLFELSGNARLLLTGERTALNFLQTLSGTATNTSYYVNALANTQTKLLDTRKTIPGLRTAQKYAVTCGGGLNHRIGLYDAFLIKENHIAACGGINKAIATARENHADKKVEVEVENLNELEQALQAQVDIVMLDNFSHEMINQAVALRTELNANNTKYEVSGNMTLETLCSYAHQGVDYISVGALTKDVKAVDLSMRFV